MREILFRGKRLSNGEWIEGWYYQKPNVLTRDGEPVKHFISDLPPFGAEIDPATVGQYTGLKDKSGKRIFEGDVVKATHTIHFPDEEQHLPRRAYGANYTDRGEYVYARNYAVKWNEKSARWEIRNGSDGGRIDANYIYNHGIEVIGNIHDNSELLKEG